MTCSASLLNSLGPNWCANRVSSSSPASMAAGSNPGRSTRANASLTIPTCSGVIHRFAAPQPAAPHRAQRLPGHRHPLRHRLGRPHPAECLPSEIRNIEVNTRCGLDWVNRAGRSRATAAPITAWSISGSRFRSRSKPLQKPDQLGVVEGLEAAVFDQLHQMIKTHMQLVQSQIDRPRQATADDRILPEIHDSILFEIMFESKSDSHSH